MHIETSYFILLVVLAAIGSISMGRFANKSVMRWRALKRCKGLYGPLWRGLGESNAADCKKMIDAMTKHHIAPIEVHRDLRDWFMVIGQYEKCWAADKANQNQKIAEERAKTLHIAQVAYAKLTSGKIEPEEAYRCIAIISEATMFSNAGICYREVSENIGPSLSVDPKKASATLQDIVHDIILSYAKDNLNKLEKDYPSRSPAAIRQLLREIDQYLRTINSSLGIVLDKEKLHPILMFTYDYSDERLPKTEAATAGDGPTQGSANIGST